MASEQNNDTQNARYDLVIGGGTVIDGRGGPGFRADVGVSAGRITALGPLTEAPASARLDASGMVVCPGFIDIHTHSDLTVLINPLLESSLRQGVTTEVSGNCGLSVGLSTEEPAFSLERRFAHLVSEVEWKGLAGFLDLVQDRGTSINLLSLAGHNTIRKRVMGLEPRDPKAAELAEMKAILAEALAEGAVGFSTGLEYPPGRSAKTEEIIALARTAAEFGGIYTSHLRNESDRLVESVAEALRIGREAGLPVQLSHHKAEGPSNWGRVRETLAMVDAAVLQGQDVTLDQYPYTAYQTGLAIPLFPHWALGGSESETQNRLSGEESRAALLEHMRGLKMDWNTVRISIARGHREYQGRTIAELAANWSIPGEEAVLRILKEEKGFVAATYAMMSEEDVQYVMQYPRTFIASDAASSSAEGPLSQDRPHPRTFGTFPRVLGHYVRELGVLTLENAVARMTSMPARRLGLRSRGTLEIGSAADITIFDPGRIIDCANQLNPVSPPVGIEAVIVDGEKVLYRGEITGARPGRTLRGGVEARL